MIAIGKARRFMLPPKVIDMTGQVFGRLTVEKFVRLGRYGAIWECRCSCGVVKELPGRDLRTGNTKSCGCQKIEVASTQSRKHGQTSQKRHIEYSRVYRAWRSMLNRCHVKSSSSYPNYGGRGIAVCPEWRTDFQQFLADMGEPPTGYTLERIDVETGYSPDNCKWVPMSDQHKNKRNTVHVLLNGEPMIQADAARKLNLHPATLCDWHKGRHKIPAHIDLTFLDQAITQ